MLMFYRNKFTNVVNKCGKNATARMSEAVVEHNVHVRVLNVHILGPNVHVYVLKNFGHNFISSFLKKIRLDSYFWHYCISKFCLNVGY